MSLTLVTVPYHLGHPRVETGGGPERLARWALAGPRADDLDVRAVEASRPFDHEIGAAFGLQAGLSEEVRIARQRGRVPVVLAGDCGASLGVVAGLGTDRLGIVWLDAHGDLNTADTTPTGFLDGTALATVLGRSWQTLAKAVPGFEPVAEERVLLVGGRSLDPAERDWLDRGRIGHVPERTLESEGVAAALAAPLARLAERADRLYVHLDLDVIDPDEVPANRYRVPGGLSGGQVLGVLERLAEALRIEALTVSAYDPTVDPEERARGTFLDVIESLHRSTAGAVA